MDVAGRLCLQKPLRITGFLKVLGRRQTTLDEQVVPQEGFEPPTPSLRMMCSTN